MNGPEEDWGEFWFGVFCAALVIAVGIALLFA